MASMQVPQVNRDEPNTARPTIIKSVRAGFQTKPINGPAQNRDPRPEFV